MKRLVIACFLIFCILLSGCSLLPQEAQLQITPVIPEYEKPSYLFTSVERNTLALEESINCTYLSAQSESLRFSVGGVYYDTFFVSPGDHVEPGQLLAQLDCTDVQQALDAYQLSLKRLELRLEAIEEDRSLAKQRQKILLQDAPAEELRAALAEVDARFNAQRESIQVEQKLLRMEMSGYEEQLAQRKLYASISGIVTYLYQPKAGERSSDNQRIIDITNQDNYVFRANTGSWDLFPDGQDFVVVTSGGTYDVTTVPAAALGLEEPEKVEGKSANIYFLLHAPAPELSDGDYGTITIQLDSRENVLTLPEKAVDTINGQTVVYYLDETGFKQYKPITTGLATGGKVEIVSGLEFGDLVIIG